jgi:hypothetical protein
MAVHNRQLIGVSLTNGVKSCGKFAAIWTLKINGRLFDALNVSLHADEDRFMPRAELQLVCFAR